MLFSRLGEILLFIVGILYIGDLYLDSFINLMEVSKNKEEEEEESKKTIEAIKHLYA